MAGMNFQIRSSSILRFVCACTVPGDCLPLSILYLIFLFFVDFYPNGMCENVNYSLPFPGSSNRKQGCRSDVVSLMAALSKDHAAFCKSILLLHNVLTSVRKLSAKNLVLIEAASPP